MVVVGEAPDAGGPTTISLVITALEQPISAPTADTVQSSNSEHMGL